MSPQTLISELQRVPFRSFTMVMNNGRTYEVRHSRSIVVGRDFVMYLHGSSLDQPIEKYEVLPLVLIERLVATDPESKDLSPQRIIGYQREVPFRSFRICLNSGRSYEVRYPETISVGRDHIVYFHRPSLDQPHDRWESLSLLLVERIEFSDTSAT